MHLSDTALGPGNTLVGNLRSQTTAACCIWGPDNDFPVLNALTVVSTGLRKPGVQPFPAVGRGGQGRVPEGDGCSDGDVSRCVQLRGDGGVPGRMSRLRG